MSSRAKKAKPARSVPTNEPPRPNIFSRIFPFLVIILAVVVYMLTLPEDPYITSTKKHDTSDRSFSQYENGMTIYTILSKHYKTADVAIKSLTTLSNPSKPSNMNSGHTIKKLVATISLNDGKEKTVHLIVKEFGSYVHPRNVTWMPRTDIAPATLEYCSEAAVLQGLNSIASDAKQIWPGFVGSDDTSGIIISEHVTSSMTLCDVFKKEKSLLTEDLFSKFGETLANFHRSTRQDKSRDFDKLVANKTHGHMQHDETLEEDLEVFVQSRQVLDEIWDAMGVSKVSNFDSELDALQKELTALTQRRKNGLTSKSDPFLMLAHGDLCPDNVLLHYDKSHHRLDAIHLVDYSRSGIRNIFYDVTFMRMSLPTCWCVEKLPMNYIKAFERAYKSRWEPDLTPSQFGNQLTKWSLYHVITTIADLLPRVWEKDLILSGYSLRHRIVDRIRAYVALFRDDEFGGTTSDRKNHSASRAQLDGLLHVLYDIWPSIKE